MATGSHASLVKIYFRDREVRSAIFRVKQPTHVPIYRKRSFAFAIPNRKWWCMRTYRAGDLSPKLFFSTIIFTSIAS